ncbi:MAG: hypothetical protein ENTB_04227 [Enterocloster aldenensis]
MNVSAETSDMRRRTGGQIRSVEVVKRCPVCGRKLYMKLGDCSGMIAIKCQKCGTTVNINLALRKTAH